MGSPGRKKQKKVCSSLDIPPSNGNFPSSLFKNHFLTKSNLSEISPVHALYWTKNQVVFRSKRQIKWSKSEESQTKRSREALSPMIFALRTIPTTIPSSMSSKRPGRGYRRSLSGNIGFSPPLLVDSFPCFDENCWEWFCNSGWWVFFNLGRKVKEISLESEDGEDFVEVKIPELNEKDGKCFEKLEELIKGQLGFFFFLIS